MSFLVEVRELGGSQTLHMRALAADASPVSFGEACELLQESERFRACLIEALRSAPFAAFFFECPPVRRDTTDAPFEWILQESPQLARVRTDAQAFAEHLGGSEPVACCWNLGHDARLVLPTRQGPTEAYAHMACFVREAPEAQVHALFTHVGREAQRQLAEERDPLWLSTSGLGVYWLHVRLDRAPKYYTYAPYRTPPADRENTR